MTFALTFPRNNLAKCQYSRASEPVISSGITGRAWAPLLTSTVAENRVSLQKPV